MRARRISQIKSHLQSPLQGPLSSIVLMQISRAANGRGFVTACVAAGAALGLAGCAQHPQPQRVAHSKEYFPSSVYGKASPRVVADGEPVPRGGGTYLVGKPYTVAGHTYYPSEKRYSAVGLASWYGDAFHGRLTANGEVYDKDSISAAHPTMPLPSYARVTNLRNNYSMIVRVNDRGPFAANRIMDVSRTVAQALDFHGHGTARVKVEYAGPASLDGSDDRKLLATLRYDGTPASLDGTAPTMVAERTPIRTASAEPAEPSPRTEPAKAKSEPKSEPVSARGDERAQARADERALASLAAASIADSSLATGNVSASPTDTAKVPLPPARPFDLGTIPGAGVPIASRR